MIFPVWSSRTYGFLLSLSLTMLWGIYGYGWCGKMFGADKDAATRVIERLTSKLMKEDPAAAAKITALRENREVNSMMLADSLLFKERMGGSAAIRSMLTSEASTGIPPLVRLYSLANDPKAIPNAQKQKEFIDAHVSFLEIMEKAGAGTISEEYVGKLEAAKKDPRLWPIVIDDSMALIVFEKVADPDLRAFYVQEREKDWFVDSMMELIASMPETVSKELDIANFLNDFLRIARDNQPNFELAMTDPNLRSVAFILFYHYGDIINLCVKERNLPLDETMEIVFANQDYFDEIKEDKSTAEIVAKLAQIKNGKPSVWRNASLTPFALRLEKDVPDKAARLFDKFPGDDIAAFLYAGYEKEIVYAADAIDKFGDLAIYILQHYQETTRFKEELTKDARIVPYMAQFGNEGLERLKERPEWMDKYFTKEGLPKEKEWWQAVPIVGAPANVIRNWASGTPSEWSELGWAALDVADGVFLAASFGTSGAITTVVKGGGKGAVESVSKKSVKELVKEATEKALKGSVKGSREKVVKEMTEDRAKGLLKRMGARLTEFRIVRITEGNVRLGWQIARQAGKVVSTPFRIALTKSKSLVTAWKSVSPVTRRIVYRTMLASGLFVTLHYRSMPILTEKLSGSLEALSESIQKMQDTIGKIAAGEFFEIKASDEIVRAVVWFLMLVSLTGVTWHLRPRASRVHFG